MNFQVGDKVKFLNEVGGGFIKEIISDQQVSVETHDGFDIPILKKELVLEESAVNIENYTQEKTVETDSAYQEEQDLDELFSKKSDTLIEGNDDPQVYFALVPAYDKHGYIEYIDFYMINDSNYKTLYTFSKKENEELYTYESAGLIDANTKIHLFQTNSESLKEKLVYNIQIIFYQSDTYFIQRPFDKQVELDPFEVLDNENYSENIFFNEKAKLYNICMDDLLSNELAKISGSELDAVADEKELEEKPKTAKKTNPDIEEVDLHIEELLDDHSGMSNKEIIDVQMKEFKKRMEEAIRKQLRRIVFIHGLGNGKLKFEIRNYLDLHYPKYKYQDASFREYGFGATLVLLRK
mgnify:CR=1 FL=1